MILVIIFGLLTIFCVVFGIKKKKFSLLGIPFVSLFAYVIIKIAMVPLPFWDTVQFIIGLR